jgi:outer membrane autotransporter protein
MDLLGPMIQIYPDPTQGFYLQAWIALALDKASIATTDGAVESQPAFGLGLSGATGYDFWLGREWSLGPELRFTYVSSVYAGPGARETHRFLLPSLSLAATWH